MRHRVAAARPDADQRPHLPDGDVRLGGRRRARPGSLADGRAGYAYSRISNPTTSALGSAYAELAGGEAGVALASGMGAIHAALASLLHAPATGSSLRSRRTGRPAPSSIRTFGGFGVRSTSSTRPTSTRSPRPWPRRRRASSTRRRSPTRRPTLADHAALADLAHRHGATYVVDNTFASPYVCRPLELGADLVAKSATKFLGGHSDVIAGVVAGPADLIAAVERVQVDTGATLGPLDAFLVLRGILTLAIRVERHAATAAALASWLERQDGVRSVLYPGLPSHPQHEVALRQFRPGVAGGMLAFEVEGGRAAGRRSSTLLRSPN